MMGWRARGGMWLGASVIFCVMCTAQEKIAELQKRFDHEMNAVHRAKMLEKLGDAQFAETRRAFKANDLVTVGIVLEKYRDDARVALEGLKKKHPDAEKQPGGSGNWKSMYAEAFGRWKKYCCGYGTVPASAGIGSRGSGQNGSRDDRMLFRHPGDQSPKVAPSSIPAPATGAEEKP